MAEDAEAKASRRAEQIERAAIRDLEVKWAANPAFWRDRNFSHELDGIVSKSKTTDPMWKRHVADNQWFMQKAIMYGSAATNELLAALLTTLSRSVA